jgi:hypothetical protein
MNVDLLLEECSEGFCTFERATEVVEILKGHGIDISIDSLRESYEELDDSCGGSCITWWVFPPGLIDGLSFSIPIGADSSEYT